MRLNIFPFGAHQAFLTSFLRPYIQSHNLSLGDRACLAVALEEGYKVLTTNKQWKTLLLDISIQLIR